MRQALASLSRYIATPTVSKHRLFVWLEQAILPDHQLIVFARDDDYFLGVLHARPHELWSRRQGTQLREAESGCRYTPSSTFETYPFPWPPGQEPPGEERVEAIADAARELNAFREAWLHPPAAEVGVTISAKAVAKRTLTALYNALAHYRAAIKGKQRSPQEWARAVEGIIGLEEIEELDALHATLDRAVLEAYGWPRALGDEEILARLLALNLARAGVG